VKENAALPARLGGGVYVQVTGRRQNGYLQVRTLKGAGFWIPENQPESGNPSLCMAHATTMRVCRKNSAPPDVPDMEDRLSRVTFQRWFSRRFGSARRARSAPNGVAQRAERAGVARGTLLLRAGAARRRGGFDDESL
jgi:hypothetical protein